jgi:hypothetical protein
LTPSPLGENALCTSTVPQPNTIHNLNLLCSFCDIVEDSNRHQRYSKLYWRIIVGVNVFYLMHYFHRQSSFLLRVPAGRYEFKSIVKFYLYYRLDQLLLILFRFGLSYTSWSRDTPAAFFNRNRICCSSHISKYSSSVGISRTINAISDSFQSVTVIVPVATARWLKLQPQLVQQVLLVAY